MSQCDQLLGLLADGEWWSTRELLREVPCIVHSRISDLRGRGLEIDHETTGPGAAGSRYRLIDVAPAERASSTSCEASGVGNDPGAGAATFDAEPVGRLHPPAHGSQQANGVPQPASLATARDRGQVASASNVPGSQPPSPPAAGDAQLSFGYAA